MGLLDNLRKRSFEPPDDPSDQTAVPATEAVPEVPDDDPWLAAVDRRQSVGSDSVPVEMEAATGDAVGRLFDTATPNRVGEAVAESLPDLGMVYAGLSAEGIEPLPVDDEGVLEGPPSPESEQHLAVLGLSPGVSWNEIGQVRRRLLADNPPHGSAEQLQRRMEVNHASAALRLLYVD